MQRYRRGIEKRILGKEENLYLEEKADEIEEFKAFEKRYSPSEDEPDYDDEDEYYPSVKKPNSLIEDIFDAQHGFFNGNSFEDDFDVDY